MVSQIWIEIYVPFYVIWLVMILFSNADNMLTVAQMQSKGPAFQKGMPMAGHFAVLILYPLLAIKLADVVDTYSHFWSGRQVLGALAVGFAFSGIMHYLYVKEGATIPSFMTYGGKLWTAGWLDLIFFGFIVAIALLFYFCTPHPAGLDVWILSAGLWLQIIVGVFVHFKILDRAPFWFPYRVGIWNPETIIPVGGVGLILIVLSLFALR